MESLSSDFKNLYLTKSLCDITIRVKDVEFKAHKIVLAARSSVFASALERDMLEKNTDIKNIDDCDPYSFGDFLQYLYTGEIGEISFKTVCGLYVTADKYNVKELKSSCTWHLLRDLAFDNVCDVLTLADLHYASGLKIPAKDYFRRNYSKIVSTAGWQLLLKTNFRLANEVLKEVVSRDEVEKTEKMVYFGLESSFSCYKDLYLSKSLCDVTIKVKDTEFKAHKTILAARSSVFASAIEHDLLDKNTGVINIDNCDPSSFGDFLQCLYTGEIGNISLKAAQCLYVTADKYNVKELKSSCISHMIRNLAFDNVCGVIALADLYDEIGLMCSAEDYFRRNYSEIVSTVGWELLVKKNYRLANKVLKKVVSGDEVPKIGTLSFGSS